MPETPLVFGMDHPLHGRVTMDLRGPARGWVVAVMQKALLDEVLGNSPVKPLSEAEICDEIERCKALL
jgi:hypothetical protein